MWQILPSRLGIERAELLIELSRRASWRSSYQESLALAQEARDDLIKLAAAQSLMVKAYLVECEALSKLNRKLEAIDVLDKVIDISRKNEDPFIDDHLRMQATWYDELEDWQGALACHLEAIQVNVIDDDQPWLARSLFLAAGCYQNLKEYALAIDYYKRAREIYKSMKNVNDVGLCDIWIGECYANLGNGELALTYGNQGLDISKMIDRVPGIVMSLVVIGKGRSLLADFEKAENTFDEAHSRLVSFDATQWSLIIEIKSELINIYRQTNRLGLAEEVEARIATIREIIE